MVLRCEFAMKRPATGELFERRPRFAAGRPARGLAAAILTIFDRVEAGQTNGQGRPRLPYRPAVAVDHPAPLQGSDQRGPPSAKATGQGHVGADGTVPMDTGA